MPVSTPYCTLQPSLSIRSWTYPPATHRTGDGDVDETMSLGTFRLGGRGGLVRIAMLTLTVVRHGFRRTSMREASGADPVATAAIDNVAAKIHKDFTDFAIGVDTDPEDLRNEMKEANTIRFYEQYVFILCDMWITLSQDPPVPEHLAPLGCRRRVADGGYPSICCVCVFVIDD